jgi:hypothetical protein
VVIGTSNSVVPGTPPACQDVAVRPLWVCPDCGRGFANPRQTHTCAPLGDLDAHFTGRDPAVRACFDAVLDATRRHGPVTVLAERSRIAFQVRMSFAAFTPRPLWLDGHVVLARELAAPRFRSVQVFSARNVLHTFRLHEPSDVDEEVEAWLAEAYAVGRQDHLR